MPKPVETARKENLRRSATEAQFGLELGGVSKMEFEIEFLFQPGLNFTFELEFGFEFKSEFTFELLLKFEFALEVAFEVTFELASSSTHLPALL